MNKSKQRTRFLFTACAFLFELTHLAWEQFNGGIQTHHFLARADMPAVSNAWGLLLIPAMAWFLFGRMQRTVTQDSASLSPWMAKSVQISFTGALIYGAALALAFETGHGALNALFGGLFVLSLILPTYRSQYLLGFVFGMLFTFGAVLPTIVASFFASISAVWHWIIRSLWRIRTTVPAR